MTNKLILSSKSKEIIGDTFLTRLSPQDLDKKISEAYLGVLANDKTLFNPFEKIPAVAGDKFAEYVTYIMSQPEYFYFIIKYIFGMETFPQQALILKELYTHKFPLLIGTRGLGKSVSLALYMLIRMILIPGTRCIITSAGFRQAKVVFDYMERIWDKAPILQSCFKGGKNGPTHGTDVWTFRLGDSLTYALPVGPDGSKVRGYRANCVHGDTLVQTDKGLIKIRDFNNKKCEAVININKGIESPKSFYSTEPVDVYELVTENGYSIKFSEIHQLNGPNGWIKANELKIGDTLELDNNDFFPKEYARHGENILDEREIFFSGLINLSTFSAKEVPWYILQSPRNIVYKYLKMVLGEHWLNKTIKSTHKERLQQLQVLLLKFNFISCLKEEKDGRYSLTVEKQHLGQDIPTDKIISINKLSEKESLYDFELLETNSFRGGGFVNHNCLISDEFSSMNRQVFEEVMSGFLTVAASPVEQIKQNARRNLMKLLYIPIPISDTKSDFLENQLILSGTAYYKINHFYSYFNKWNQIIMSKNDPKLLKDMFKDEADTKNINPDSYSIIRIPVELTAHGYMDMDQVTRIKASTTKDVFLREYSACLHPSTKILTQDGQKRIKDIRIGDMVLTHKGRFRKVNKLTYTKTDHLLALDFYGNNKKMYVTDNHPIYIGNNEFKKAGDVKKIVFSPLSKQALSNKKELDLRDYLADEEYSEYGNFIRSKHGFTKLNNDQLRSVFNLFNNGKTKMEISKSLGIKYNHVYNALNFNSFNKINPLIKIDYNLGIVLGYYAAEGSTGSDGRSVSFALDGHVDKNIIKFVKELKKSIKLSFNIDAVEYNKKDNTVSVTINNKIIASFIKKVCPGICYDKTIDHNLLFSNENFMKGFVVGFWNGDGHKRKNASKTQICSENLIAQIRLVLSYFKVPNAQYIKKGGVSYFKNKEYIHSNRFKLEMFMQNNKLFLNKFYNGKNKYEIGQSKYYLENNEIHHKLRSKSRIPFNGYVYNIEVDDDHSYHTEFGCVHNCFNDDSDGFFKKSLIDSCTSEDGDKDCFPPALYGTKVKKYVYGVDPAYEGDNFAVVILELNGSHRRVVHTWTTQASDHKQRLRDGVITEHDYYHYCARKIRDLMKRFPCEYIALDSQGGGNALMEAFRDITKIAESESVILPTIEPEEKTKETDLLPGLHIIKVINFTSDWISKANYALKKDMEDKAIRFPMNDAVSYALSEYYDESMGDSKELYDTLDDCIFEIEELKKELTTIVVTETTTGREKFDTPSVKVGINRKGRLKKDRYSALLMANAVARDLLINDNRTEGGDILNLSNYIFTENKTKLFRGNSKIADQLNKLYGGM